MVTTTIRFQRRKQWLCAGGLTEGRLCGRTRTRAETCRNAGTWGASAEGHLVPLFSGWNDWRCVRGASRLPICNGSQHVDEIATMSLHVLNATVYFQIGHIPEEKLMLRIGIHTGTQHWDLWSRYASRWFWSQALGLRCLGPWGWRVTSSRKTKGWLVFVNVFPAS